MKLNFFLKPKKAFALDVSGASFKIFQFERRNDRVAVKGYAETPVPKGLIINDVISDAKTFAFLLKQALDKPQFGHIDTRDAIVSLPESKSFVRVIQIPRMSDAEADNAVPFESENFIPMPIDQVYLDWQYLGENADGKMNILIIATPKEFVDSFLGVLDKASIRTVALEVESQSCHRALIQVGAKETSLIVNMSANRSSLIMVEEGNLQFTSTVPIAGNSFTESIARALGVSSTKAEEIKRKVGVANTTEYPNIKIALLPILTNLSAEIKNILKFHGEHSDKQVSRIVLAGGSARLKNMVEFLTPEFSDFPGLSIQLGNPWVNIPTIQEQLAPEDALGFVTSVGLAMRGIE